MELPLCKTLQAAARRLNSNRKNVEVESVGVAGKFSSQQTIKKYFRMEVPLTLLAKQTSTTIGMSNSIVMSLHGD